jgi:hypothetical protein
MLARTTARRCLAGIVGVTAALFALAVARDARA